MAMTRRALFGLPLALPAVIMGGGATTAAATNKTSAAARIERAWSRVDVILDDLERKLVRRLVRGKFAHLLRDTHVGK